VVELALIKSVSNCNQIAIVRDEFKLAIFILYALPELLNADLQLAFSMFQKTQLENNLNK